jgi:hypothetical protein
LIRNPQKKREMVKRSESVALQTLRVAEASAVIWELLSIRRSCIKTEIIERGTAITLETEISYTFKWVLAEKKKYEPGFEAGGIKEGQKLDVCDLVERALDKHTMKRQ